MTIRKSDFTLPKLDDLFTTQEMRDDAKLERVRNIPLVELHPFKGHPLQGAEQRENAADDREHPQGGGHHAGAGKAAARRRL